MRRSIFPTFLFVTFTFGCGASWAPRAGASGPRGEPGVEAFRYTKHLSPSTTLILAGFNGGIDVSPSDDDQVSVQAILRKGERKDVQVVAKEDPHGLVVCVLGKGVSADACQFTDTERIAGDTSNDSLRVDLVARIPRGVSLIAKTLNGGIAANAVAGNVHATTMNGDIAVSSQFATAAETLNGSIEMTLKGTPTAPVTLQTNNGKVVVRMPKSSDVDVESSTTLGSLTADFPLDVNSAPGSIGPKNGRGRVGHGGVLVHAETLNGDVEFKLE